MVGGWAEAKPRARAGGRELEKRRSFAYSRARPELWAAILRAVLGRLTPQTPRPLSAYYRTYLEGLGARNKGGENCSNFWQKKWKVKRPIKEDGARVLKCW